MITSFEFSKDNETIFLFVEPSPEHFFKEIDTYMGNGEGPFADIKECDQYLKLLRELEVKGIIVLFDIENP